MSHMCRDVLTELRTWKPGDPPVLPDLPDSAYLPGAAPLPEPRIMSRTPWSNACAIRHDHGPAGCDGSGPRGLCGCPCHVSPEAALAALTAGLDAPTPEERLHARVVLAGHVVWLAARCDPTGLASHAGDGPDGRAVRRLGRALSGAARLHTDTQEADRG